MAVSPKSKSLAPGAASLTDMFTCPDGVGVVAHLLVVNRSATPTSFRASVAVDGAADATDQYVAYDKAIQGNTIERVEGICLSADDVLRVYATLATLSFRLFYLEFEEE